ncbi:AfsR/SARP family transcriptional regulator [Solicola gregarius]|uniref:Winged helix-turn-helix domain-containing protein n=1 Tax=Solicola gregarius TaxID=2908642 RepID=A0AA46YLD4_9ACTN|nr:BTAD domain-containing putative transcriptional regulator [Solicola gregarius]UYM06810.1 winged helix-turn-helix domain-containing protein [Solicola gregarius]
MLEIRLVGTVEALLDGQPVELPGRRVRALLAVLALTPGETVSVESLGTAIWGEDPPERVRGSLQTYVARMRRVLGGERVATRRDGYALLVPRDAVDLLALWDGAQGARREADSADECAALAAVLARWHDEPFGEAPSEWLDRNERPQWEERRLQVFERWVDLSFEAGNHRSCLEELNQEVERHPLREPLWVRLLGALDRMGRTAEALEAL